LKKILIGAVVLFAFASLSAEGQQLETPPNVLDNEEARQIVKNLNYGNESDSTKALQRLAKSIYDKSVNDVMPAKQCWQIFSGPQDSFPEFILLNRCSENTYQLVRTVSGSSSAGVQSWTYRWAPISVEPGEANLTSGPLAPNPQGAHR
jgi:hypothetical protein